MATSNQVKPASRFGKFAKLTRSSHRDLRSDAGRGQNWGIGEARPTPDLRESTGAPAGGIGLALAAGLILWAAGIYLFATLV